MASIPDRSSSAQSRLSDFAWIALAYIVALAAAWLCVSYFADSSRLLQAAYADVVATLVIFVFSRVFKNSSFYDAYWSVAPPVLMAFWWSASTVVLDARHWLVGILVMLWAIRLTHNWARGWSGLSHVDWRYVDLQEKTGFFYPLVDLLGIQLLPTALVFLGCLPLWYLSQSNAAFSLLDGTWIVIGYTALWLEFRADNVLRAHRLDTTQAGTVLQHDVWAWCRHPNYLGELGFWLSLGIAGYLATGLALNWLGTVAMIILFLGISIPMIDKRQLANKPGYAAYKASVPSLIPWPPAARRSSP